MSVVSVVLVERRTGGAVTGPGPQSERRRAGGGSQVAVTVTARNLTSLLRGLGRVGRLDELVSC